MTAVLKEGRKLILWGPWPTIPDRPVPPPSTMGDSNPANERA
jgi:hypothetical protein